MKIDLVIRIAVVCIDDVVADSGSRIDIDFLAAGQIQGQPEVKRQQQRIAAPPDGGIGKQRRPQFQRKEFKVDAATHPDRLISLVGIPVTPENTKVDGVRHSRRAHN